MLGNESDWSDACPACRWVTGSPERALGVGMYSLFGTSRAG
jgi:hypothetical protein